jgi:hypothetical protein
MWCAYGSLSSPQQAINRTANGFFLRSICSPRRNPCADALILPLLDSLTPSRTANATDFFSRSKRFARNRRAYHCSGRTTDGRVDCSSHCCLCHSLFCSSCSCCCCAHCSCAQRRQSCPYRCPCPELGQSLQKDCFALLMHYMPHDLISKSLMIVHNSRLMKHAREAIIMTSYWNGWSWVSTRRR